MLKKIKALFGFGPATPAPVEAPYKVEVAAPVVEPVAPMPVGIEAVIATPVVEATPSKAPKVAKPKAPAKPKAEKAPKAATKAPAVKKPRAPKAK